MIAVIKYSAGNVLSVMNALSRLGAEAILTDDVDAIRSADKVIFPGVGEASSAMRYLDEHGLSDAIRSLKQPFLGICLGMQLMCSSSEEGDVECLGLFPERTGEGEYVYFVHSYYAPLSQFSSAVCEYGGIAFSASLSRDNFHGMQFHPEKSGDAGERMLRCFLEEA